MVKLNYRAGAAALTTCVLLGGSGAFYAQGSPPPASVTPKNTAADATAVKAVPLAPKAADKNKASLDMDEWRHDEQTGVDTGRNFVYIEGDTRVTGNAARYNGKSKVLDSEGNLVLDDPKHHVTGEKAHVDNSKKKLAVITNHVVIVLKPSSAPDPAADSATTDNGSKERNRGATITCDQVDDYYKANQMTLKGHLIFKQHIVKPNGETVDRMLTAEHAEYDGKAEKMKLFSPVEAHDTDGQDIAFTGDVVVGTKEGKETLATEQRTKMHLKIDSDEPDQP